MPRPRRVHIPGGFYHVTLRGNHREPIFGESHDRAVLNEIVAENLERQQARLHAYCWMTNHLHALIQVADSPLAPLMQRIAMRYARYRQHRMDTTGHLFDKRYGARHVNCDRYFLAALRYIHLNPKAGGLVADPADYPWSSHRAYLGCAAPAWLTTAFALALFDADLERARHGYQNFMAMRPVDPDWLEWDPEGESTTAAPTALAAQAAAAPGDCVYLDPATQPTQPLSAITVQPRSPDRLSSIITETCARHRVDLDQLRSRSKARCYSIARQEIARRAVETRAATATEIAELLDRDVSSICRLLMKRHGR